MLLLKALLFLSAFLLIDCASNLYTKCPYSSQECHKALPSMAYVNAKIYTVDQNDPEWHRNPQEAMVVENGIIAFIGTESDANEFIKDDTKVIDMEGSVIIPGIHDVHMHPLEVGYDICTALPSDALPESRKFKKGLMKCTNSDLGTDWVLGHGYSILMIREHLDNGGQDPKLILDSLVSPDIPVLLMEETSHSSWANSEALRRAGITRDTPNPPGGIIMKNSDGEPNGILLENAGDVLWDLALDPDTYPELNQVAQEALSWSLKEIAKNGITSICDARTYWGSRKHHKVWQDFAQDDKLTARVILGLWAYPGKPDGEQIESLKSLYSNDPGSRLRMSQIKVYVDGLLESTTAATLEDYLVDYGLFQGSNNGMNYFDQERLAKYIRELQNTGFDFHIHAIGDRGVREGLNAIESSQAEQVEPMRHRLTHVELVSQEDIPRFASLNIPADMQIPDPRDLKSHKEDLEEVLGEERTANFLPLKELVESGAKVTLSSDWDVNVISPFLGMHNAVNKSIGIKEAVEMYTIHGAYTMRQEEITGSLEVGKEADFVVIDRDIFHLYESGDIREIKRTDVLQTVLAGNEVWTSRFFKKK